MRQVFVHVTQYLFIKGVNGILYLDWSDGKDVTTTKFYKNRLLIVNKYSNMYLVASPVNLRVLKCKFILTR